MKQGGMQQQQQQQNEQPAQAAQTRSHTHTQQNQGLPNPAKTATAPHSLPPSSTTAHPPQVHFAMSPCTYGSCNFACLWLVL